ncbi:hypothetical protein [Streptomyces spongiae]|uniref:Uncharacterized protein n=1 Tax=Streptomyces spongiae TaxID=565072 RepID=A0A5N8XUP6_9ACTN|nr:hypothetical protein [Streptomyces spongiae]MPY63117.1 hypothetical protein [Streptomyces spongiae]
MRHPYRLPTLVFVAVVLVVGAAWLWQAGIPAPESAAPSPRKTSTAEPSAPDSPGLADSRLGRALIGKGDLGTNWGTTAGAATWRDGLLKGEADRPECQELLDAVYAENLLGEPTGATAVAGFDDTEYGAQVRYQVGTYRKAEIDARLDHLGQLAEQCQEFTSTTASGRTYDIRVTPVGLPGIGDAGQALRMTVTGDVEGEQGGLTLDVAALRVGDGAALLTHGGLYGINTDTTRQAVQLGAQRLQETFASKPQPSEEGEQEDPVYEEDVTDEGYEAGAGESESEQDQEQ